MTQYILHVSSYAGLVPGARHLTGRVEGPHPPSCHGSTHYNAPGHRGKTTCDEGHEIPEQVTKVPPPGPDRSGRGTDLMRGSPIMHDQAVRPRLAAVPAGPSGPEDEPVPYTLTPRGEFTLGPPRITLGLWQRQEAEDARQLLYRLAETDAADLSPGQLAFTLGRLHGAGLNLLDIIDAITEP